MPMTATMVQSVLAGVVVPAAFVVLYFGYRLLSRLDSPRTSKRLRDGVAE
jgi:hypothetical protein